MHFHAPFPMHRCSRIVALASRHVEAITPAGRACVSRRKGSNDSLGRPPLYSPSLACRVVHIKPRYSSKRRRKSLRASKKDRPLSCICLFASKPNADRTEVCLAPSVDYNTLIARHPYMRTLLEHTCDSTCEGTRAERACGGTANGSSRGAEARHSAMRCACRHGVWEGAVGRESRPTAPASHVDDEACVSFCMLREGKSANDPPPRAHHHHASGSFMC